MKPDGGKGQIGLSGQSGWDGRAGWDGQGDWEDRPALVACDLDGTLLDGEGAPLAGMRETVAELVAAGVVVVVCSGRPAGATRTAAARLGLRCGLAIGYHGAVVLDLADGRWVRRLDLPPKSVGMLVGALRDAGAGVTAYVDDERLVQAGPEATAAKRDAPVAARVCRDLAWALEDAPVTRLIVEPDAGSPVGPLLRLAARWPEVAMSPAPGGRFEVHHAGADKRSALAEVCRMLAVPAGAVVACGDGPDDAAMLRWAGLGVAVAEGDRESCAAAAVIVGRADLAGFLRDLAGGGAASAPTSPAR